MVSPARCQQLLPCSNLGGGTFFYPFYHFLSFFYLIAITKSPMVPTKFQKLAHHHTLTDHAQLFVSLYEMWNLVRDVCYHILKII
jgi:hypothetical protein